MPAFQLIIFDFDGTLADSGEWMVRTFGEVAHRFGARAIGLHEARELRGYSTRDVMARLGTPMWRLPQIAAEMRRRAAADADRIPLFEGVDALLRTLDERGLQLAIVSSNSEANVRRILGPGNAGRIDVYDCEASMFGKARKLRAVMKRCGVTPAATLCVGDETRDIEAARAVRAAAGAVTWGYATAEILATFDPTMTFDRIGDIVAALG
jgi:phosphoglycolate phosphatase